jgi:hypothetical protein
VLRFWSAPLRFFTREIPKNRQLHVLQLLHDGVGEVAALVSASGAKAKSVNQWKSDFERGRKSASASRFFGKKDFSSSDLSECFGAATAPKK